jgi:glycosyltransferase involved in cell wall biosynthesis
MKHQRRRLLHLTTTDISLELLLGPQLSAFIDAGYEVHAASASGPFVEAIERRGVIFHGLEHSTRSMSLLSDVRAASETFRLFRELRPDIVHTHNPKPGIYGRVAGRLARVPVVVNTVHGLYAQPTDPLPRRAIVYGLERFAAAFSHAELVQNSEDLRLLKRLRVPSRRLYSLGNGIDLERFVPNPAARSAVRAELGLDDEAVVLGAVGRLVSEKGYPELFEAAATVTAAHDTALFLVAGPHEPDKADAMTSAQMDSAADAGVRFLGHRSDVEALYPAFDIYVLASHREGFPRSAMEAAASGLPLVVTDIRGCREVVDDGVNGLLVPVNDPAALAEALNALVTDSDLRRRLAAGSITKAARSFDQQNVIDTTLAVYDDLLRQPL